MCMGLQLRPSSLDKCNPKASRWKCSHSLPHVHILQDGLEEEMEGGEMDILQCCTIVHCCLHVEKLPISCKAHGKKFRQGKGGCLACREHPKNKFYWIQCGTYFWVSMQWEHMHHSLPTHICAALVYGVLGYKSPKAPWRAVPISPNPSNRPKVSPGNRHLFF